MAGFTINTVVEDKVVELAIVCAGRFPDPSYITYYIEMYKEAVAFFQLNHSMQMELLVDTVNIPKEVWKTIHTEIKYREEKVDIIF